MALASSTTAGEQTNYCQTVVSASTKGMDVEVSKQNRQRQNHLTTSPSHHYYHQSDWFKKVIIIGGSRRFFLQQQPKTDTISTSINWLIFLWFLPQRFPIFCKFFFWSCSFVYVMWGFVVICFLCSNIFF